MNFISMQILSTAPISDRTGSKLCRASSRIEYASEDISAPKVDRLSSAGSLRFNNVKISTPVNDLLLTKGLAIDAVTGSTNCARRPPDLEGKTSMSKLSVNNALLLTT